jgi:hypothetical protein
MRQSQGGDCRGAAHGGSGAGERREAIVTGDGAVLVGVTRRQGQRAKDPARVLGREHRDRLLVPHLDQLTVLSTSPVDHTAQMRHGEQPA